MAFVGSAKTSLRSRMTAAGIVVLFGLPLYVWVALGFTYSVGERVGFVQKIAKSGLACETYNGDLAMVSVPGGIGQTFHFNVRDTTVARQVEQLAGHRVVVHYEQHKGVPSTCFGDSEYFVTGVRRID